MIEGEANGLPMLADELTPADEANIVETLRDLRSHFSVWPGYLDREFALYLFAIYEQCHIYDCCAAVLKKAAPCVLGKFLVTQHDFRWGVRVSGSTRSLCVLHYPSKTIVPLQNMEHEWLQGAADNIEAGVEYNELRFYESIVARVGLPSKWDDQCC